jgi:Uma2 family endonuclease
MMSVEEYLNASFPDGDCEYVDGLVVGRSVPTPLHSWLQKILLRHFDRFERSMGFVSLPECRTRVTASRYRVPDILLAPLPVDRYAKAYGGTPLAIIEILSPGDTLKGVLERFGEYERLGVRFIIQMDPEARETRVYQHGNLLRQELTALDDGDKPIPFDTVNLYSQLEA